MVTQAVMKACDTLHEGFLTNPRACTFDFKKLACAPGAAASEACLTPPQMKTVETFYGGLHNSKGELIFSGQALGNPLPALRGNMPEPGAGNDTVRIWAFQNDKYDWHTFDLDRDMPIINSKIGFVDAVEPDLSKFKAHGGKLLLYAGWGDTTITPENTVLVLRQPEEEDGAAGRFRPALHGPRHGALPRRRRPEHVRLDRRDGGLAREGRDADAVDGLQPADEPDAADLLLSAVHEIQGHREHQGRRQLDVRGAVAAQVSSAFRLDV